MKKSLLLTPLLLFLISCSLMYGQVPSSGVVDQVNPYMGNISHLLVPTYPTIHLPNSMLRVYPERSDYTGDQLAGLPLVVTSHRGSSAFNLSPYQGEASALKPVIHYSYDNEQITPYDEAPPSQGVKQTAFATNDSFTYPAIHFMDKTGGTEGAAIYHRIVPVPESLIRESILGVVKTLYWTPADSIPAIRKINYTLEDVEGISAKGGGVPEISIFYSSRWVEQSAHNGGDDKVLYETEGVLYHELTHGFQLEPQGIGSYGTNRTFFAFIEGMADAVRAHNGYFPATNRKPGGHWMDGYQTTGFFLQWLTAKDPDFLRKFNRTALEVIPWSFDGAVKKVLGEEQSIDTLWEEYQLYLTKNK